MGDPLNDIRRAGADPDALGIKACRAIIERVEAGHNPADVLAEYFNVDPARVARRTELENAGEEIDDTYTTQEGARFSMHGATCPNGHASELVHRTFPSGYFRCPDCGLLYDEPVFDSDSFIGLIDD